MIKLNENEYSYKETGMNEYFSEPIKHSRFENISTFSGYFTKYNIRTGNFSVSKKIKYISQNGGVPLGIENDSVLVDSSDSHTLVLGSTGSKKSRLVIMPAVRILADAGESMIVSDPKSEIFERTSGYLKNKGYDISVINLRNPDLGNSWNPLYIPYLYYKSGDFDKAYEFANDIAANLFLTEMALKDPFWDYSSRDLFFGLELLLFKYCFENNTNINCANISNLLKLRHYLFKNYYSSGISVINESSSILNQYMNNDFITSSALIGTVNAPEKTQASILSTFDEKMRCFTIQPKLLNLLSSNNICLDNIGDKKTAIYIIMPDEKTTYHKLVTLFIKQSYEYIVYQAQKNNRQLPIRVNFILDEFASLPAINDFPAMISASRSRNIRFTLVVQSKNQLTGKYQNEATTIQSNCNNWVFLTSRETEMLKEISNLCGYKRNGERLLIPMDYLQHLNKEKGEALVLSGRLYPIIIRLADIKKYDDDMPLPPISMKNIQLVDNSLDYSKDTKQENKISNSVYDRKNRDENNVEYNSEEYDLQKELERKFDELFGPIDDSDD